MKELEFISRRIGLKRDDNSRKRRNNELELLENIEKQKLLEQEQTVSRT